MSSWRRVLTAAIIAASVACSASSILAAPPAQENQNVITSPAAGSTVSGVVQIIGTVTHPNFVSYGVLYASGPEPTGSSQWVEIVFGVQTQVTNGVLATWDTTARTEDGRPIVPNGVYTLALARYKQGSDEPDVTFVRNVTVSNQAETEEEEATPTPTPELTEMPTAQAVQPTAVLVEQPPTSTPPAALTTEPDQTPSSGTTGSTSSDRAALDVSRLRGAFFSGVKITLLLFFLWGLYVTGKAILRYYLRTQRLGPPDKR